MNNMNSDASGPIFNLIATSHGSMGYTRFAMDFYRSDSVVHENANNCTKLYQGTEPGGGWSLYIYSNSSGSYIEHLFITGLISNVNDIQVIDDTPDNMDLSEITLKKVSFAE